MKRFEIHLTDAENEAVIKLAKADNRSRKSFIEQLVRKEIKKHETRNATSTR